MRTVDTGEILRGIGRRLSALRRAGDGEVRLTVDLDANHSRCCDVAIDGRRGAIEHDARDIVTVLRGLRDEMVAAGGMAWSRCAYVLRPDGTFHLGIEYPAVEMA